MRQLLQRPSSQPATGREWSANGISELRRSSIPTQEVRQFFSQKRYFAIYEDNMKMSLLVAQTDCFANCSKFY